MRAIIVFVSLALALSVVLQTANSTSVGKVVAKRDTGAASTTTAKPETTTTKKPVTVIKKTITKIIHLESTTTGKPAEHAKNSSAAPLPDDELSIRGGCCKQFQVPHLGR